MCFMQLWWNWRVRLDREFLNLIGHFYTSTKFINKTQLSGKEVLFAEQLHSELHH